jgi:hypothetical protein
MVKVSLVLWLLIAGACAALGNYSYSYMERTLKEVAGYQPKFLKYPQDI